MRNTAIQQKDPGGARKEETMAKVSNGNVQKISKQKPIPYLDVFKAFS